MKGDPTVIEKLNLALTAELTAINQYFIQAKMNANWGYHKLAQIHRQESMEEMKHAELLIERILFLEGVPEIARYDIIRAGVDVKSQFEADLALEIKAVKLYNEIASHCVKVQDNVSRELVETLLIDSEHHVDWLETQLMLIEQVGIQNYLTEQIGTPPAAGA